MPETQLFYLFSEEKKTINTYDINNLIKQTISLIEFLACENYYGYYDSKNLCVFISFLNKTEEEYPNILDLLRIALNKCEDWRNEQTHSQEDCYQYFHKKIEDNTLCELANRKYKDNKNAYLLINNHALKTSETTIFLFRNNEKIFINILEPIIAEVVNWLSKNRIPQRIYTHNPKHGEYGKGAQVASKGKPVSILMCSKEEAEELLLKAIGEENSKDLFYFDNQHQQYIQFKLSMNNNYHGFHLDNSTAIKIIKKKLKDKIKVIVD